MNKWEQEARRLQGVNHDFRMDVLGLRKTIGQLRTENTTLRQQLAEAVVVLEAVNERIDSGPEMCGYCSSNVETCGFCASVVPAVLAALEEEEQDG